MLGIIIGVSSVITIITVGNSGKDFIIDFVNEIGGQSLNISASGKDATDSDKITDSDIDSIRKLDIIENVSPMSAKVTNVSTQHISGFALMQSANHEFQEIMSLKMLYGRYYTEYECNAQSRVAVVDSSTALAFFGREDAVGESIELSIEDSVISFKIIGVYSLKSTEYMEGAMSSLMDSFMANSDNRAFGRLIIPISVVQAVNGTDVYKNCYITTQDIEKLDQAGEQAVSVLAARHNNFDRDVYVATNMASLVDMLETIINIFTIFISAVGAISLVVGGIGVMNIMLVSVTERTREVGIRKALGARTRTILVQFLTESIIICLIGGIIGMAISMSISSVLANFMGVPLSIKVSTVLVAIGFSSAIGMFFGIYPARKAAKMMPIDALRRE
jgi:putative ABC transport system permease protein